MMTSSTTLSALEETSTPSELLLALKKLKNALIGNTWRKVEVAEDEGLLRFLLDIIAAAKTTDLDTLDDVQLQLINETAVIFAALANVGPLTLRPLISSGVSTRLLILLNIITSRYPHDPMSERPQAAKLVPSLLRALRNVLISTADLVWGHMWGVGAERKTIDTGLLIKETSSSSHSVKGKEPEAKGNGAWAAEASRSLSLVFELENLHCLLYLLQIEEDPQVLLPIYQILARLVALPYHRKILIACDPPRKDLPSSSCAMEDGDSTASTSSSPQPPFILDHLLSTGIIEPPSGSRKGNTKLLEAALDLMASLFKGQPELAASLQPWTLSSPPDECNPQSLTRLIDVTMDLIESGPIGIRIAAASCLTNVLRAQPSGRTADRVRSTVISFHLIDVIAHLLKTESLDEQIRLCFILTTLVSDDANLQRSAAAQNCPEMIMGILWSLEKDAEAEKIGSDLSARTKEAGLLALASLSFLWEPTRALIASASPPFLPYLLTSLRDPSYGARAASCQLARALSRTVAILRTSLVDTGVGEAIIETLKREVAMHRKEEVDFVFAEGVLSETIVGERAWTVEVAATATICNLIADFSPLRASLLLNGGMELLCELTRSPWEPLAINALWAIKNLTYRAVDSLKLQVMMMLTWEALKEFIRPITPADLRSQGFGIIQNLLADGTTSDIGRTSDSLGGDEFLDELQTAAKDPSVDLRVPALYVLSNLALGSEKVRQSIVSRVEILEALSDALNAKEDIVKTPTLRCLRHLIESNAKSRRPRQPMIEVFQPYQLKSRVRQLSESSPSLDVCQAALGLIEVLDKGREPSVTPSGAGGFSGPGLGIAAR